MRFTTIAALALFTAGSLSAGSLAIGVLQLNYDNGYQEVSFTNYTGIGQGCQVNDTQYSACTAINIDSWVLTVTFASTGGYSNAGYTSPMVFTGSGIPVDGTSYVGDVAGTGAWEIPLSGVDVGEPACPPCDYQVSSVEFSGILDPTGLNVKEGNYATFDASNPSTYTPFVAQSTFDTTWQVSSDNYTDTNLAGLLFFGSQVTGDSADVIVEEQPPSPPNGGTVPEPRTMMLLGAGLASVGLARRARKH